MSKPNDSSSLNVATTIRRPATLQDVAKLAGVSIPAASKVLHNSSNTTRVGAEARERILAASEQLNYSPNGIAQAFRRRSLNIFGLYTGEWIIDTQHAFLAAVVGGMQVGCNLHHKDLLIHGSFRGSSIDDIYKRLISGRIDGLVMFAQMHDELAAKLSKSDVPVIAIADHLADLPFVGVDDAGGSRLVARYLAMKGHQQVLYHRGAVIQSSQETRYEAFIAAAKELDMTVITLDRPSHRFDVTDPESKLLLQPREKRPTAVVCCTDIGAQAMLTFCRQLHIRVPQDLAIVGFDGLVFDSIAPVLTTIAAPWAQVATVACNLLAKRLAGASIPPETILPVELLVGETA